MNFRRMAIEVESPEERGYCTIDHNLSESSVSDLRLSELGIALEELLLSYPSHRGLIELRERIAAEGTDLHPDDVLITAGAAGALFLVAASMLSPGDRVVVTKPNYSTNLETPRVLETEVVEFPLAFEKGYRFELDQLERQLTHDTKFVSLTVPHNPTGTTMTLEELFAVIRLVESRGAYLLCDETYRQLAFREPLPPLASLSNRVISISSLSKAYGIPGIRIGWLLCKDRKLMESFLAAKEQVCICTSIVDEQLANACLERKDSLLANLKSHTARNFSALRDWMVKHPLLEWVEPTGGAVCFPRFKSNIDIDLDRFYDTLTDQHRTLVGSGHWFDEDKRHFRIGFGYPTHSSLQAGLHAIDDAAVAARR
jgi:aspartate/methionine/tyrosine aminotransferase